MGGGQAVCVFCGMELVDQTLNSIDKIYATALKRFTYTNLTNLLLFNQVSGCTEMINREVYEHIGSYSPKIDYHDWWTALYACSCGVVVSVPMALILYRQHHDNFFSNLGRARQIKSTRWSRMTAHIRNIFNGTSRQQFYKIRDKYKLFRERYSQDMTPENLRQLDNFLELFAQSRLTRLKALKKTGYTALHGKMDNLFFIIGQLVF